MKLFRRILVCQASYIILTAVWPILDIESFMQVTGYKTDVWLVKTVGALLIPIALTMIAFARKRTDIIPALILSAGTAFVFICIDVYYALKDVISDIYLADAVIEFIFLLAWIYVGKRSYDEWKKSIA